MHDAQLVMAIETRFRASDQTYGARRVWRYVLEEGSSSRNPNLLRSSAVTASVTHGRRLRYAEGSARSLLHHRSGHCLTRTDWKRLCHRR